MIEGLDFLLSGISIGTTFALLPSPLLALLISETLQHGKGAGIKIALVPPLSDIPIIALSLLILSRVSGLDAVLGGISLLGAAFLAWIGLRAFRSSGTKKDMLAEKPQSFRKGLVTNFLNPNPYIFWMTVGTPALVRGFGIGPLVPALYLAGFFGCLIGIRAVLALGIHRFGSLLESRKYLLLSRFLALVLVLLGLKLAVQGILLLAKAAG